MYTYYLILEDFFRGQIIYLLRSNNPSKVRHRRIILCYSWKKLIVAPSIIIHNTLSNQICFTITQEDILQPKRVYYFYSIMSQAIVNRTYTKTLPKAIKTRTKSWLNIKNNSTILEGQSREENKIAIISTQRARRGLQQYYLQEFYRLITQFPISGFL